MAMNPLLDVPGLGGYLAAQQMGEQQLNNQLQQAGAIQTLQSHYQQQAELNKAKEIIGSETDPTKVITALVKMGPTGAAMAQHYASAIKSAQEVEAGKQAMGVDLNDPEALRRLGIARNKPEYLARADQLEKRKENTAALSSMRSAPAPMDTQEAQQSADFGTPAPQSRPGVFSSLMSSPIPAIAAQAKELQRRLDSNGDAIPAQHWQDLQARLATQEATYLQRQPSSEPLYSVIGKDGKPVYLPRAQAAGMRPASNAELPALTGGDLTSAAAQAANGQPLTQVVPGYGRNISDRRESVRREAISQIKAQNPSLTDEQAGQEFSNRQIDFAAGKRSVTQLNTMLGATRQAVDQLNFNVDKVSEAMKKLPSSDLSPIINAIARGASKWTGDPAYSELFYYMHAAAMESARILQGGQASVAQLHQGAANEAKQWADANFTTPAAWESGVAPAMKAEGEYRIKTYESAMAKQRPGHQQPAAPGPETPDQQPPPKPLSKMTNAELMAYRRRLAGGQ